MLSREEEEGSGQKEEEKEEGSCSWRGERKEELDDDKEKNEEDPRVQYRMQLGNRCNYDRSRVDEDGGFFFEEM